VKTLTDSGTQAFRNLFERTAVVWNTHTALRQAGLDRFEALGFDTKGREDWMYSDMGSVGDGRSLPMADQPSVKVAADALPVTEGYRLVFLNGLLCSELSDLTGLPDGVTLQPLADSQPGDKLGAVTDFFNSALAALNTAFWRDGLYLAVADGVKLDRPVNLVFVTDTAADHKLVPVRNLIVAGSDSSLTVVEHYHGNTPAAQLPLTEVHCAAKSVVQHVKLLGGEAVGQHLGSTHVVQHEDSVYRSWEIALGGDRTRRELHLELAGPGASCELNALYMGDGDQRFDMRTRVNHAAADCRTVELYKGILDGNSRGVFDGLINVARDSQRTAAFQTNRTLLLSDDAVSHSIPRLEIYADDVKCSHGSTTGQLNEDQIFYLRSRGFTTAEARAHLATAFAAEVLENMPVAQIREDLTRRITARLHGGMTS